MLNKLAEVSEETSDAAGSFRWFNDSASLSDSGPLLLALLFTADTALFLKTKFFLWASVGVEAFSSNVLICPSYSLKYVAEDHSIIAIQKYRPAANLRSLRLIYAYAHLAILGGEGSSTSRCR